MMGQTDKLCHRDMLLTCSHSRVAANFLRYTGKTFQKQGNYKSASQPCNKNNKDIIAISILLLQNSNLIIMERNVQKTFGFILHYSQHGGFSCNNEKFSCKSTGRSFLQTMTCFPLGMKGFLVMMMRFIIIRISVSL